MTTSDNTVAEDGMLEWLSDWGDSPGIVDSWINRLVKAGPLLYPSLRKPTIQKGQKSYTVEHKKPLFDAKIISLKWNCK